MHKQKVRWILKTHRQVETGRRCGGRIKSTEIVNGRCWLLTGVHRCCQCAGMHGMSAFDLGNFGKTSGSNWLNGSKLVQARNDAQFVLSIFVDQLNERWACFDSIRHYKNPTKVFLTEICNHANKHKHPKNLRDFEKKKRETPSKIRKASQYHLATFRTLWKIWIDTRLCVHIGHRFGWKLQAREKMLLERMRRRKRWAYGNWMLIGCRPFAGHIPQTYPTPVLAEKETATLALCTANIDRASCTSDATRLGRTNRTERGTQIGTAPTV